MDDAMVEEVVRLREENERLKEFSKTKGEVIEGGQRVIADLQSRLSAAEREVEFMTKRYNAAIEKQGRFYDDLKRAEAVVEAAKGYQAGLYSAEVLDTAIRRYEEGE